MSEQIRCGLMTIKADSSTEDGDRRVVFDSIISSDRLDTAYERFGDNALKQMAEGARKGVKILPEHNHSGQPIGKTLGGTYDETDNVVSSKFYLQRGLEIRSGMNSGGYATSDDYIAAAEEGTSDNLSVGARVNKETCDICGEEMHSYSFFGMRFVEDTNGHYPGKKILVNSKNEEQTKPGKGITEKRVTATIEDTELMEVSMVAFGANRDAVITSELQTAFQAGELNEKHLLQLNDRFSIKTMGNLLVGGSPTQQGKTTMSTETPTDNLEPKVDNEEEEEVTGSEATEPEEVQKADPPASDNIPDDIPDDEPTMALHNEPMERRMTASWQKVAMERKERIDELETEVAKLKQDTNSLPTLRGNIEKLEREVDAYRRKNDRIEKQLSKIAKYDDLCSRARDATLKQFIRAEGGKSSVSQQRIETERQNLENIQDYDQIMGWHGIYQEAANDRHPTRKNEKENLSDMLRGDRDNSLYV